MQAQATSNLLMIRPVRFGFNEQTAGSNSFQDRKMATQNRDEVQQNALREFDEMTHQLIAAGVNVIIYDDLPESHTPDSIFPNNWVSFHYSGTVVVYPMEAPNRRLERRMDIIDDLSRKFDVARIIDLTHFEQEGKYLEGTGSLVFDRMKRVAYACLSPRTDAVVLAEFAEKTGYSVVTFSAVDAAGIPVYHTNVVMCIGDVFAIVCLAAIVNPDERLMVRQSLVNSGKHVIDITMEQMAHFAGNMLLVTSRKGQKLLIMSTQAFDSLTVRQRDELDDFATLFHFDLGTIERNGGGSARCMMAEIHLPAK
ncbi:citrulline utilization hydrolase CtlX [Larkinella terrae]|uniref:Amidinotransferase n=1 Tax=Larkinella terrae TaxID=2025311 RepID=A0A7K0EVP2_9BACT|nr:arginine deiminase-related protein [Larkinella terrae]MRS65646.1 amidinotransferase [Larkinella terrae]